MTDAERSVNRRKCLVSSCRSSRNRNPELSFHTFPKKNKSLVENITKCGFEEKLDRYKAWKIKLKLHKSPSRAASVCSLHFQKDDFLLPDLIIKRPRLKSTAVPSLNLPFKSPMKSRRVRRPNSSKCETFRKEQCAMFRVSSSGSTDDLETEIIGQMITPTNEPLQLNNCTGDELSAVEALLELHCTLHVIKRDKGIQVKSGDLLNSFTDIMVTTGQLTTMTGLASYELLDEIVEMCKEIFGYRSGKHTLSLRECVIFTFIKLKTGMRYAVLSVLFNINKSVCRIVFHETLVMLAKILETIITWPEKEEIMENMPICFKDFQNVRAVIDCTEIPVEQVKCLCCRLKTYSHYKKKHTVKVMTAVSPAGIITFISKAYGGRASDKQIFIQSGIIEKLDPFKDHLMVDKGFKISDITDEYGIRLIQPPFLEKKKQFSKEEALLNAKIARARVHIERVNQRIKTFEIFSKPLPYLLLPQIDNIFTIVCAIVNLSKPIFGNDKFL